MGGSKDVDAKTLPEIISLPDIENNIHSLCLDAREEVELHGDINEPAAVFIGKLYSDLHDCTILFRQTVEAARLSDPNVDIPLPSTKVELKKEFDGMMSAYNLYTHTETKLRKRCMHEVKSIETFLDTMLTKKNMTIDECINLYGFDPRVFTEYVLPKLVFITKLVFRFRSMSETLLFCYQKRLGLIKEGNEKDTLQVLNSDYTEEADDNDDTVKYDAMKEVDDYISDMNEDDDGYDTDNGFGIFGQDLPFPISENADDLIKSYIENIGQPDKRLAKASFCQSTSCALFNFTDARIIVVALFFLILSAAYKLCRLINE